VGRVVKWPLSCTQSHARLYPQGAILDTAAARYTAPVSLLSDLLAFLQEHRRCGELDADALLQTFADQAGIAIENVRLFTELQEKKELNEKQEEYLKDIYASGTHLLSLVNDILDLSKIEAGRMELELTDFDLPTALDNTLIVDMCSPFCSRMRRPSRNRSRAYLPKSATSCSNRARRASRSATTQQYRTGANGRWRARS
jgi:hypothetical protein